SGSVASIRRSSGWSDAKKMLQPAALGPAEYPTASTGGSESRQDRGMIGGIETQHHGRALDRGWGQRADRPSMNRYRHAVIGRIVVDHRERIRGHTVAEHPIE